MNNKQKCDSSFNICYILYVNSVPGQIVDLTCVWISSLMDGLLSFFFFTARSSTRGLIVIPWRQKQQVRPWR